MATRVGGFTLTWLILGVLFFPFVWIISYVFIKRSIALEDEEVAGAVKGAALNHDASRIPVDSGVFSFITVVVTIAWASGPPGNRRPPSDFFVAGRSVSVGWNASAISGEYLQPRRSWASPAW